MHSKGTDGSKIIINGRHAVNSIFFVEDGKHIVSGNGGGMLQRWRADDGREIGEAMQTGQEIAAAALSPNRQWLVCGFRSSRSNVKVWDVDSSGNLSQVQDIKGHTNAVTSVDVSPDSTKLATGSDDKYVFIWDMPTKRRRCYMRHDDALVAVQFSPEGDRLATATLHKSIRIYDSAHGKLLLDVPCPFRSNLSSPLVWSADGCQLYAASYMHVRHFRIFQGRANLHREWFVRGGSSPGCIALSRNQKFIAVAADKSLSFWDTATHKQTGSAIEHGSKICSISLSPDDDLIAIGDEKGKITLRDLCDILSDSYLPLITRVNVSEAEGSQSTSATPLLPSQLLLLHLSDAAFRSWTRGDLAGVERILGEEIRLCPRAVNAFAQRALVRCHLKHYDKAVDDAQISIDMQSSIIGHIALIIARVRKAGLDSAIHLFDLVYVHRLSTEHDLLLLVKAILLFDHDKSNEAMSLVDGSIRSGYDNSLQIAVKARMLFLLGGTSLKQGDYERAAELLGNAQIAMPIQRSPRLVEISLITGWDFENLPSAIQQHVQACAKPFEDMGDAAVKSNDLREAVKRYSAALSLDPSRVAPLLVKRSKANGLLGLWEDALRDADKAIEADSQNPLGYERKYVALHALQRYNEAVNALDRMASFREQSLEKETQQLAENFATAKKKIEDIVHDVLKRCPFVLVEVRPESGFLCDELKRMDIFKSELQFKELVSSMTLGLDVGRIRQVVAEYFKYVTFSHVWEGKEPSYQDVKSVNSVWNLDRSPLNNKLRSFCEIVCADGYRWAWSDTCCINKEERDVLHESLNKMYNWYEDSAATFAFLTDVSSPSTSRRLKNSKWMTRAWTSQELLAPKVIRFYDRNWKPYLGDSRKNHKESPAIMQELADAVGLAQGTIKAFDPDSLSVREKLRLVSAREATKEEDIAYSLIGIFQSDIRPHYGEGAAALGHLLAEIVSRSGEVTVFAWAGQSSSYNSCLPATLAVYKKALSASHALEEVEMDQRVAALGTSIPQADAMNILEQITRLQPARFSSRRLYLPCIIFRIKRIGVQSFGSREFRYRARVPGIGHVEFDTSDRLSMTEPRKLILVHPWIHDLRDPFDGFAWGSSSTEDESDSDSEDESDEAPSRPLRAERATSMDAGTRAFRLLVRLQQPFHALLLQQQPHGEFRRVAAEHDIVVPRLDANINFAEDICAQVVEIL